MTKAAAEPPPSHDIDIQWGLAKEGEFPEDATMTGWVEAALARVGGDDVSISVRFVSSDEMTGLNSTYRGKSGPTNVLSFPADGFDEMDRQLMGDIAICTDVVINEANDQGKALEAHMAHMLIHGVLHLAGYDHINDADAVEMERLETDLLHGLGFDNPYEAASTEGGTQ